MGGYYSSIEDLKYDSDLRKRIEEAIQGTIKEASDYSEISKKVVKVETKNQQFGNNSFDTGGHVLIGNNEKPITINQKVKAASVVHTLHLANYLKKQKEPIVQIITSDLAGLTEKNSSEKELPKWYDPTYILSLIGISAINAQFDFDNQRINYTVDPGKEQLEKYKENVKKALTTRNEKQKLNKEWNDSHAVTREINQIKQEDLKQAQDELKDLYNSAASTELKANLEKSMNEKNEANRNLSHYLSLYINSDIYKLYHDNVESRDPITGELIYDEKTKAAYETVINNEIYKNSFQSEKDANTFNEATDTKTLLSELKKSTEFTIWGSYVKYLLEYGGFDDLTAFKNEINKISLSTWLSRFFKSEYNEYFTKTYGADKMKAFKKDIETFMNTYNVYVENAYMTALANIITAYQKDPKFARYLHKLLYNDEISESELDSENKTYYECVKKNKEYDELTPFEKRNKSKPKKCEDLRTAYPDLAVKGSNLNDIYTNIMKYKKLASTAQIRYVDYQNKFKQEHKETADRIDELEKEIKALEDDLNDPETINSLKYYEYYDTEELSENLLNKLTKDIDKSEIEFNKVWDDDSETSESRVLFAAYNRQWIAENDIKRWKMAIEGWEMYQMCSDKAAAIINAEPNGPHNVYKLLQDIINSEEYKSAYDEYTKEMTENEKQTLVDVSDVIMESKNDKLYSDYTNYLDMLNEWRESIIGINAIMNCVYSQPGEYKEEHAGEYQLITDNWASYNAAIAAYPPLHEEYLSMKADFEKKYGDAFEKKAEMSKAIETLKAIKSEIKHILDNYDEIVNGNPKQNKSFEDLFAILASGYVQNVNEKMETFKTKTTNIFRNIEECSEMYASNQITIQGSFNHEVDLEQTIDLKAMLENSVRILDGDITKIKDNIKKKNKTTTSIKQEKSITDTISIDEEEEEEEQSLPTWLIILIIILSVVLVGGIVFIIMLKLKKRRNVKQLITVNK